MKIKSQLKRGRHKEFYSLLIELADVPDKRCLPHEEDEITVRLENDSYSQIYTDAILIPNKAKGSKKITVLRSRFEWQKKAAEGQLLKSHRAIANWAKQQQYEINNK